MAWCPVCKNEYRAGIKVCADCGAELVESLEANPMRPLIAGEGALIENLKGFLEDNGVKDCVIDFVPDKEQYVISVPEGALNKAAGLLQIFMNEHTQQMQKKAQEQMLASLTPEQREELQKKAAAQAARPPKMYESSAKKAEENRASAWSLLVVGAIGLLLIVLCLTGVIPLPNAFNGSYMFFGVMGALCVVFVIMGIVSFANAKGFEKNVESENSLKDSLETWCKENLRGADIDNYIQMRNPGLSGEALFFPRMELIKARINHQFLNLDQAFLEQFVDEVVYEMVFPEEDIQ